MLDLPIIILMYQLYHAALATLQQLHCLTSHGTWGPQRHVYSPKIAAPIS